MPKKPSFDPMKFIPLGIMAVSLVSGYTLLQSRVANSEEKIKAIEVVQTKMSGDTSEIKVSQAKTETKLDAIYEVLKDIKAQKR